MTYFSSTSSFRCRVIGTGSCYGIAAYSAFQRASVPIHNVGINRYQSTVDLSQNWVGFFSHQVFNRRWLAGFSALFVAVGTVRAII